MTPDVCPWVVYTLRDGGLRMKGIGPAIGPFLMTLLAAAATVGASHGTQAQTDGGYRLVPNWPKLPPEMYFGLKDAPPPPAEREAQAAARRARGGSAASTSSPQAGGPTNQPGISGLAIDQ